MSLNIPEARSAILRNYGVTPADLIHKGMEAEAYRLGADKVLKLYPNTTSLADLTTLQDFYTALDAAAVSYALPYIYTTAAEGDICTSVERFLPGSTMSTYLRSQDKDALDPLLHTYLSAALELSRIPVPPDFTRYKLFDPHVISRRSDGDWHQFLKHFLEYKLVQVAPYLERDVTHFAEKMQRLFAILAQPYSGPYHLIHGDFFPGNLHLDAAQRVIALLDFGLFTMYGDPLFDIATAWVFFDMYDEFKASLRSRLLAVVLERLGHSVRGRLYRYVLIYSVLAANAYSPTCADGQYVWCVQNLNNPQYWDQVD